MRLKNNQLEVLWAVIVETGEDDAKYSAKGESAFLIKLAPHGEVVRDVRFPHGVRGAIIVRDHNDKIDGELYDSEVNLKAAWDSVAGNDRLYIYPPWKQHPKLGMKG